MLARKKGISKWNANNRINAEIYALLYGMVNTNGIYA